MNIVDQDIRNFYPHPEGESVFDVFLRLHDAVGRHWQIASQFNILLAQSIYVFRAPSFEPESCDLFLVCDCM